MSSLQDFDKEYAQLLFSMSVDKLQKNKVQAFLDTVDINYVLTSIGSTSNLKYILSGFTALHIVVLSSYCQNQEEVLCLFLKHGADVTCKDNKGFTPLRLALETLEKDDYEIPPTNRIFDRLLSHQVKIGNTANPACKHGISHFHLACMAKNLEAVKFFLESGVSVNEPIKVDSPMWPGFTPLHLAITKDNRDVIELLLKHGADFNLFNPRGMSPLHCIIGQLIMSNEDKHSDEHRSYYENILDKILESLENDLEKPVDDFNLTHLHLQCLKRRIESQYLDRFFNNNNVNVNATVNSECHLLGCYTPLHLAISCGNVKTAKCLLRKGANLFVKNSHGATPLDYCLDMYEGEPLKIIEILKTQENLKSITFENGLKLLDVIAAFETPNSLLNLLDNIGVNTTIPLDSPIWPGATILHLSILISKMYKMSQSLHIPAFAFCLNEANAMSQDANGMTAFHLLFYSKSLKDFVFKLMDEYMDVSANPIDTNTSLSHFHIACITKNVELVRMFLSNGVNPDMAIKIDFQSEIAINGPCMCAHKIRSGYTALHMAVALESEELVKLLLEHNADPLVLDAQGFTWMHRAFLSQHFDLFKPLLWLHPNALKSNPTAPGGLSHFHVACRSGNLEAVKALLPFVTDIDEPFISKLDEYRNKCDYIGKTALHWAIEIDSKEIVELLLKNGADMRARKSNALSPFYKILLSSMNVPEIIKRVTREYEEKGMWPDDFGMTRLHVACAIGDLEWIKILLEAGEDVNSRMNHDAPIWSGSTPLHVLVKQNLINSEEDSEENDAIEFLLNHILENIESRGLDNYELFADADGLHPFHISCMAGDTEIVEKFLDLGVDVNVSKDCFAFDDPGFFPLHFAVKYGKKSVVELLLKRKINIESKDMKDCTPLHLAASKRPEFIDLFIRLNEFDIEAKNLFDETVIDLIIDENALKKIDAVKSLIAFNNDFSHKLCIVTRMMQEFSGDDLKSLFESIPQKNEVDVDGRNFIHHLVSSHDKLQHKEFAHKIEVLVMGGCELDYQDNEGRTPLHQAVTAENPEKVMALLSIGADINVTDKFGKTPLTFAPNCLRQIFHDYVKKLKTADFYLHPLNENFIPKDVDLLEENRFLQQMSTMPITNSISIRDFLTEKMIRQTLSSNQRHTTLKCIEMICSKKELLEWIPLFKLQQRKIEKRQKLLRPAITSLQSLHNDGIPDHCLESILIHLSNEDWQNLIRATDIN